MILFFCRDKKFFISTFLYFKKIKMKIKEIYEKLLTDYPNKLKIFKKWIFWILLEEEAFFMWKFFNFKITQLDKETIKIWFPDWSKNKWLKILDEKNIWYILVEKKWDNYQINHISKWKCYNDFFSINLEDFLLTKERILGLNKIWLEDKNEKNFLLQIKIEELYMILSELLIKLPKKQRYFFREKLEKIFLDNLELIYKYKYDLDDRKILIQKIFSYSLILREFCRMLYNNSIIKNDNVYLDLWDRWIEVLKICKSIKNKS